MIVVVQVILLQLLVADVCAAHKIKKKGKVKIVDVRKTKLPEGDAKHHKYHDVEVYRTITESEGKKYDSYKVYHYSKLGDSLFCFYAGLASDHDFTMAWYKWENDTLADIKLYKKGQKKKERFKVFGVGHNGIKTSGMITEE